MLAVLRQALMSPMTGPIALAVALMLAVALGVSASQWEAEAARYEARIRELTEASERAETGFRTELAACRAAGEAREKAQEAGYAAAGGAPAGARRLLEQQPEGIDACARMESADRAVLSNLKP
jgi:hypothetical protein